MRILKKKLSGISNGKEISLNINPRFKFNFTKPLLLANPLQKPKLKPKIKVIDTKGKGIPTIMKKNNLIVYTIKGKTGMITRCGIEKINGKTGKHTKYLPRNHVLLVDVANKRVKLVGSFASKLWTDYKLYNLYTLSRNEINKRISRLKKQKHL